MSIFVYAGAAQYMSLTLISKGVDPILIVLNTFVVNIRHFLMTAALNEKMQSEKRWVKGIYAFGITDEIFSVLATQKERQNSLLPFAFGVAVIAYSSWVIFTASWTCYWRKSSCIFTSSHVHCFICDVCWITCSIHAWKS